MLDGNENLRITMPDGSKWDVAVHMVAYMVANKYCNSKFEMENYFDKLYADPKLLVEEASKLSWHTIERFAKMVDGLDYDDFQTGLTSGKKEIVPGGR